MAKTSDTGIIIQARYSSTRLPGKLFMNFINSKKLIDVFLSNLLKEAGDFYPVVLATSTNKNDDIFEEVCGNFGVEIYRGSESDVLQRFIDAADAYKFKTVVRVCADNPIYDIKGTLDLLGLHNSSYANYTAYNLKNNLPSIKSHLGFWGEVVELSALKKVVELTNKPHYHEHVTNFIYTNPDIFKINLINAPDVIYNRDDIRLTIDTIEDFELVKNIYNLLYNEHYVFRLNEIVGVIENNPDFLEKMRIQINKINK